MHIASTMYKVRKIQYHTMYRLDIWVVSKVDKENIHGFAKALEVACRLGM